MESDEKSYLTPSLPKSVKFRAEKCKHKRLQTEYFSVL